MTTEQKPKRKKPVSTTVMSTRMLESEGWTVCRVEQRIPGTFITRDAFGFGDLLCCKPSIGTMLVQSTTGDNMSARIAKIQAEPRAGIWLASGGEVQVHGWRKLGKAGKRKVWEVRVADIFPGGQAIEHGPDYEVELATITKGKNE